MAKVQQFSLNKNFQFHWKLQKLWSKIRNWTKNDTIHQKTVSLSKNRTNLIKNHTILFNVSFSFYKESYSFKNPIIYEIEKIHNFKELYKASRNSTNFHLILENSTTYLKTWISSQNFIQTYFLSNLTFWKTPQLHICVFFITRRVKRIMISGRVEKLLTAFKHYNLFRKNQSSSCRLR